MPPLNYQDVRMKPVVFLAMTALYVEEFDKFLPFFSQVWDKHHPRDEKKRGRPPEIRTNEDRLFFILFYYKTYPLQEVLGHLFGISQERACELVLDYTQTLKEALDSTGDAPERTPEALKKNLSDDSQRDYLIDGTERRIQRPGDDETQKQFYSGKKKAHTVKNNIIAGAEDKRIEYLSQTHEGKKHDKKICDEEPCEFPEGTTLTGDLGYQGYEPEGAELVIPIKKPSGGELSENQKDVNTLIASFRVSIEHIISSVKRLRIVKDVFRNIREGLRDVAMEIACGMHNFRTGCRSAGVP